jgi:hypothetical protein
VLGAADVRGRRVLWVALRPVDVGPGRRVQDEVDVTERRRRRLLDVPVRTSEAACVGERLDERGSELAGGARYDDASRAERIGDVVLQM